MRSTAPRHAALVFLAAFALGCLTTRGVTHLDEALHLATADALARTGRTVLDLDAGDLWVAPRRTAGGLLFDDGEGLRSSAQPGLALLALPGAFVTRPLARAPLRETLAPLLHPLPTVGATLRAVQRAPGVIAFAVIGPLCAALACAFVFLAARRRAPRGAWLAVLAFGAGSSMLGFAGTQWTQLPVTAALAFALFGLVEHGHGRRGALAIGGALALAVLVRLDALLFVPPFVASVYFTDRARRRSPSRSLGAVLGPVALATIGLALAGLPASGGGWSFATWPGGALGLLVSPQTGLAIYAPFVLLAPWGLRREPLSWVLVGAPAATWVFYAGWFDWPASLAYGPRFLLPALPMLAVAFATPAARRPRLAAALILLGALIALPGALVAHPRLAEGDAWAPAFVEAWLALGAPEAAGSLGVDCASTYVLAYPALALVAALVGLAVEARGPRRTLAG